MTRLRREATHADWPGAAVVVTLCPVQGGGVLSLLPVVAMPTITTWRHMWELACLPRCVAVGA